MGRDAEKFFARDAGRDGIVCYQRGTGQKNPRPADLSKLLDILDFNQVVIFVNSVAHSSAICELLKELAYSVVEIHRGMQQEER